jgi:hypothetical protein
MRRRWHGSGDGGGSGCILQGLLIFIVKMFLCGIFIMCGGNWQGHTSPHTLVTLEVKFVGVLLGGEGNCPQKLGYVNTKN